MKIDGRKIANKILLELKKRVFILKKKKVIPHLAVILVGNDPSSISYVNQKKIKGEAIGEKITIKTISTSTTQSQLLKTIEQLNNNNNIYGIIVQKPLPSYINTKDISQAIDPNKDVDGFLANSKFQPPIALAVFRLLKEISIRRLLREGVSFDKWLKSQKIVIFGKGETGGKPVINVLKKMKIKPSVIDSKTPNPQLITKKADIIISAVGKPNIVQPEIIKKGVILISVGMHKGKDGKLHGDYDEEKIKNIVSFYTPIPGGVGPVNVAMLLKNLVIAAENLHKLDAKL